MSDISLPPGAAFRTARILVVGIGSPHGDDQVGWRVAQMLLQEGLEEMEIRLARSPGDLLNWMDPATPLIVIDACRGADSIGSVRRWNWPAPEIERLAWSGTHDLGLSLVLELGEQLNKLPHNVTIWSIQAGQADSFQPLSAQVEAVVTVATNVIADHCRWLLDTGRSERDDA